MQSWRMSSRDRVLLWKDVCYLLYWVESLQVHMQLHIKQETSKVKHRLIPLDYYVIIIYYY